MGTLRRVNLTKWDLIHKGPLTASGSDEIIASFMFKKDGVKWAKDNGFKTSRYNEYEVVRSS